MLRPWAALAVGLLLGSSGVARAADPNEVPGNPPGQIIRGIVVDEAGRPVAGARVRTTLFGRTPERTTTGADGSFRLAIRGKFRVGEIVHAETNDGGLLGRGLFEEPKSTGPADPVRIVLKPTRSLTIRVRDGDGRAVAGAAVEIGVLSVEDTATTDADGRVTFRVAAESNGGTFAARKSGVGFDFHSIARARPGEAVPPLPEELTLTLDGARTVRIKAVDTTGLPVAGVAFWPLFLRVQGRTDRIQLTGSEIARVEADDQGVATFDWLPSTMVGSVEFLARDEDYTCPDSPFYRIADPHAELQARLLRKTSIRGVVHQADDQPAAGVMLQIEGYGATSHYCRLFTRTAADGSYSAKVFSEQSYMIAVRDDQRAARTLTGVIVHEGQPWEALDLKLIPGTLIHGQVTGGPEGKPVANVTITLTQRGQPLPPDFIFKHLRVQVDEQYLPIFVQTDADGRYQIRVGPGRYALRGPRAVQMEELTIGTEAELVRDFHAAGP